MTFFQLFPTKLACFMGQESNCNRLVVNFYETVTHHSPVRRMIIFIGQAHKSSLLIGDVNVKWLCLPSYLYLRTLKMFQKFHWLLKCNLVENCITIIDIYCKWNSKIAMQNLACKCTFNLACFVSEKEIFCLTKMHQLTSQNSLILKL